MPSALNPPPGCRFHTRCPQVIERCRVEVPQLLADGTGHATGHATACHRTADLPPPENIVPSDGGFSPTLEKLVAAFSKPAEAEARRGVDMSGAAPTAV
jgi:peptide/nickel transport system ATP-binding protein/oligopeptide transport system ATP-binding protein